MLTAADSNLLMDIWNGRSEYAPNAVAALRDAQDAGVVLLCDVAYAEVCTLFGTQKQCDEFLKALDVAVESLTAERSFAASRSWMSYLRSGGKRSRILPDFFIAAHATNQADQLITRDRGFYRSHFPKLKIVDPSKA